MNPQETGITNTSPDAPMVPTVSRPMVELLVVWVIFIGALATAGGWSVTAIAMHRDSDLNWFWSNVAGAFAGLGAGTVFFVTAAALGLLAEIADSSRYVMFRSAGYQPGELP